jgi:hypothetical protein
MKVVSTEIANAEKFNGRLSTLFIATTNDHDATLQQEVRLISDKRVASDEFAVGILFWDDIVTGLALNPIVFKSFYPQIQLAISAEVNRDRLLAALELGYYGPYLWEFVNLTFGEVGLMAGTNPDLINIFLRTIEQRASQLLSPKDTDAILAFAGEVRSGCYSVSPPDETHWDSRDRWKKVKDYAERIADRVRLASSLLPIGESNMLETGKTLGHIYHNIGGRPSTALKEDLRGRLRGILPESYQEVVDQKFKAVAKAKSGYNWVPPIYTCLERGIRWAML